MKSQCEANLGTWKQLSEERKKQKEQAEQERAEAEKQEKEATENSDISSGDEVRHIHSFEILIKHLFFYPFHISLDVLFIQFLGG